MRILVIFIVLLGLFPVDLEAQTHQQNHEKYWYYRWRLRNHFMKIGPNQGESLIANERGLGNPNHTTMVFGDQTFNLGYFMAILAMEYNQLAQNNQNTDQTIKELYYTLYALNRLDLNAESVFREGFTGEPNPLPGDLNGFFVRDDVDKEFYTTNFAHFNNDKIPSEANLVVTNIKSDWIHDSEITYEHIVENEGANSEMSMDQVFTIMMGIGMVQKFIPSGIIYDANLPFQDGEYDIKKEAENILRRIIRHCNGKSTGAGNLFPWRIKNPILDRNVNRGANMGQWAFGISQACINMMLFSNPGTDITDFQNGYSQLNQPVTTALILSAAPIFTTDDNANMFGLVTALSGIASDNFYLGAAYQEMWHLPLIREVLYGETGLINPNKPFITNLLNEAPCEGTYMFEYPNDSPSYEWSTNNRILHPDRRGEDAAGLDNNKYPAEYPGLDYMLYHNLYYTLYDQQYNAPFDLVNNIMTTNLPFNNGVAEIGTDVLPFILNTFNTITAYNTIFSTGSNPADGNARVTYRAGYAINLEPDFEVHSGAVFHGYIDPYTCAPSGLYERNAQVDGSGSFEGLFLLEDFKPHFENKEIVDAYFKIEKIKNYDENDPLVTVYPNPSKGIFNVNLGAISEANLTVLDISGKIIFSKKTTNRVETLDLKQYTKGMYFLKIENQDTLITKKLMIE